jgi:predicted amidohydrolase
MKVAQIQMNVADNKAHNFQTARNWCKKIKDEEPDLICLPEMFNCPYDTSQFPKYAELEKGDTWQFLSELAKENNCYLIGGSIPEIENEKYYNTCYFFDRKGRQIGKHRKMHLFDIDVKGGQRFMESDILSAGNNVNVIDTEFGKIGIAICYDIRFPELIRLMVNKGAESIFIPAAFNMTTGPAHWEILFRTRALDNQVYVFGIASAQDKTASYHSYGHSILVSPWGDIVDQLEFNEGAMINSIDFKKIKEIREQLPLLKHQRLDVYKLTLIG